MAFAKQTAKTCIRGLTTGQCSFKTGQILPHLHRQLSGEASVKLPWISTADVSEITI